MSNESNIFQTTDCLSKEQLLRYIKGEMTKSEMRTVELHIADCEICFDAVEGLSFTEKSRLEKIQLELQQRIQQKLQTEEKQRVIPFYKKWYSAAAAIALLLLFSVYLIKKYGNEETGLAETKNENNVSPAESVKQITGETLKTDSVSEPMQQNLANAENEITANQTATDSTVDALLKPSGIKSITKQNVEAKGDKQESENIAQADVPASDDYRKEEDAARAASDETVKDVEVAQNKPVQREDAKAESNFRSDAFKITEKKSIGSEVTPQPSSGATIFSDANIKNTATTFDYALYDKGLSYFNAKDYPNALKTFNQLIVQQPANINSNYYAGVSNYYLGNYAASIQQLGIVTNAIRNSFYESALWYKGNAYLKLDNKKEAKKIFESIIKLKGNYKNQAEELLKDL